jgi:hypothetical protein
MSQVVKIDETDPAHIIRFERVAETTSKELLQHTADLGIAVKLIHLETESLRVVKEHLHTEMIKFLKAELDASATSFGNQVFSTFLGKATSFFDNQFSSVNTDNDDLKKTIRTWSNLSLKSIGLLTLAAVLIGVLSFFSCYYLMPSQRLTQDEMNYMYYGQSYAVNMKIIHPEVQKLIAEGANKLRQTVVPDMK